MVCSLFYGGYHIGVVEEVVKTMTHNVATMAHNVATMARFDIFVLTWAQGFSLIRVGV